MVKDVELILFFRWNLVFNLGTYFLKFCCDFPLVKFQLKTIFYSQYIYICYLMAKCCRTTTISSCRCIIYKLANKVWVVFIQYLKDEHSLDREPNMNWYDCVCCTDRLGESWLVSWRGVGVCFKERGLMEPWLTRCLLTSSVDLPPSVFYLTAVQLLGERDSV